MCKMASFVLTRDNVYWSAKTDSHEDILSEFGLKDSGLAGKIEILRVEISPENGDYLTPRKDWKYKNHQDLLPEWVDAQKDEDRARAALELWWKTCVVDVGEEIEKLSEGDFKKNSFGTINAVRGGTINAVRGSAAVTTYVIITPKLEGESVLIDRSGDTPKIFLGGKEMIEKPKAKKGKKECANG